MTTLIPVAVSPLRQRLIDEREVRRFGRETQRNYIRDVGWFATWLGRSPDTATAEELRRFQVEQRDLGLWIVVQKDPLSGVIGVQGEPFILMVLVSGLVFPGGEIGMLVVETVVRVRREHAGSKRMVSRLPTPAPTASEGAKPSVSGSPKPTTKSGLISRLPASMVRSTRYCAAQLRS